jgi:hypothetical protein
MKCWTQARSFALRCEVLNSGANPTIASYNASAVNFYNASDSLARFENKIMLFYIEKRSSLHATYNAGVVAVNSKVVGLAPGMKFHTQMSTKPFRRQNGPGKLLVALHNIARGNATLLHNDENSILLEKQEPLKPYWQI